MEPDLHELPDRIRRVMGATDRSPTADAATRWAARLAGDCEAELVLCQVVRPDSVAERSTEEGSTLRHLEEFARELSPERGSAMVVEHIDPAAAIVGAAQDRQADVLVVGNVGMHGRRQFLLGNVPNRISHTAGCTVVIVNTDPHGVPQAASRAAPDLAERPTRPSSVARMLELTRIAAKYRVLDLLRRDRRGEEQERQAAARLRDALEEAGPTFAKLGQMLSTRPDLVPSTIIAVLQSLQEDIPPMTQAEVVEVMEEELRVPWEDVFSWIDPEPLAAGTIAQAHRATLESGQRVVVKVQRPAAESEILQDLHLLQALARRLSRRAFVRRLVDLDAVVDHLSASLTAELDFGREAGNLVRMKECLRDFSRVEVPAVYENLSTRRVLVMQEIPGVSLMEAPEGAERREACRQLLESYCHQMMVEGFFHADPHPGNLLWWNGVIYLLDLGMVGTVDASVRSDLVLLLLAFVRGDALLVAETILDIAGRPRDSLVRGWSAFSTDIVLLVRRYRALPLREMQLAGIFQDVTKIALHNRLPLPAFLVMLGKALGQVQIVVTELDAEVDPFLVAQSYLMRAFLGDIVKRLGPRDMYYDLQKARFRLSRLLEAVEGAAGVRPGGNMQIDFRPSPQLEETLNRTSRRLAIAATMAGSVIGAGLLANSRQGPRWLPLVVGAVGPISLVPFPSWIKRRVG